jgi:hypothetical protein
LFRCSGYCCFHARPETCRAVAAAFLKALNTWRKPHPQQQQQQQQAATPSHNILELHLTDIASPPEASGGDVSGQENAATGLNYSVKGAASKATRAAESEAAAAAADGRGAEAPASAAAAAGVAWGLDGSTDAAAAADILQRMVRMSLQGSSTSSSEVPEQQHKIEQQQGGSSSISSKGDVLLGLEEEELLIQQLEGLMGPSAAAAAPSSGHFDSEAAKVSLLSCGGHSLMASSLQVVCTFHRPC